MPVGAVGSVDMIGVIGSLAQNTTAEAVGIRALKEVIDTSAAIGEDLAALASGSNFNVGQLNVYA